MSRIGPLHMLGTESLLNLYMVAFLCSRNCPAGFVKKSVEWAALQRDNGTCVITGSQSPVEKEVLYRLLDGSQPVIVALAKGLMKELDPAMDSALNAGRLLIITRYAESVTHACEDSCYHRNRLMLEMADEAVIGYAAPGGKLERLCREKGGTNLTFLS